MRRKALYSVVLCLVLVSCYRRYKLTGKVCNNELYVEFFQTNPAGVDAEYLTDSVNFRHFVGKIDEEHERYTYKCQGDSIYIKKFVHGNDPVSDTKETLVEEKVVDLRALKAQHKFD